MYAKTFAGCMVGMDMQLVEVEVDYRNGLSYFAIVGLPDKAVQESRERIISAIRNSGAEFVPQRVIINLAPANLPKTGPVFDLAISVGFLLATEQLNVDVSDCLFLGELALDGKLKPVNGVLPIISEMAKQGMTKVFLPKANEAEARMIKNVDIYPIENLSQLVSHFRGDELVAPASGDVSSIQSSPLLDFAEIVGQYHAKRALEIAAAGGHNLLMFGAPGAGKTMLAKAFVSILPKLNQEEALEVNKVYSIAGRLNSADTYITERPFRAPHHSASPAALIGGGSNPRPGEISLAHLGVLFLDEFPEFSKVSLESLRQPLEEGTVLVSRAARSITFPARFQLLAAMNPCPCGFYGTNDASCKCAAREILQYRKRISGPVLDRIDMRVSIPRLKWNEIVGNSPRETSESIKARVLNSRQMQSLRFNSNLRLNAHMSSGEANKYIRLDEQMKSALEVAQKSLNLSTRSYYRILKLARTIADLEGEKEVKLQHIMESLSYKLDI